MDYPVNKLSLYLKETEVVEINNDLRIRLSKEHKEKYSQGLYDVGIDQLEFQINEIKKIGIKYPGNANPIFYVYVVPDDNFRELLQYPSYINAKGGGKPVASYDLDCFQRAYGVSNIMLENRKENSIMKTVNGIHEFTHSVGSMFSFKERFISEGFAEALPLYILGYENQFNEYKEALKMLKEDQIFSAKELIEFSNKNEFNKGAVLPNKSCSFDYTYISSYLFIRVCIEAIEEKYNLNKEEAAQKFLEIVMQSSCSKEWHIYDIADSIGLSKEELLNSKKMQINVIKSLCI